MQYRTGEELDMELRTGDDQHRVGLSLSFLMYKMRKMKLS